MNAGLTPRFQEQLDRLPGNAQVAFGLACAERSLDVFAEQPEADVLATMAVYNRCKDALRDAWTWETARGVAPHALYRHLPPLLACENQYRLDQKPRLRDALFAVVSALYFTTWKAEGYASRHDSTPAPPLPNDIADVTDDTLAECAAYAAGAAMNADAERRWQQAALQHLLGDISESGQPVWGPPIAPTYFYEVTR